jgi:glycosyltransferase involved in cell wall biosynthesis
MSDKLRVGFVSLEDPNDVKAWSGTPFHLLSALKRQNASIMVFSPLKQNFRYPLLPFKIAARLVGKEVEFSRFRFALRSYSKQLEEKLREQSVDVVLSTSSIPITMLECYVPIVFITDAIFHMIPGYYGGVWNRLTDGAVKRGKRQEEAALERCTIGAYASNWAAEGARKLTQPSKIRVVPFGASISVDHDRGMVEKWVEERLSRMPTECHLLFVGVDWVRKGGDAAVETARLLNEMGVNTKLSIVGGRPEGKVPDFVETLGFVSKQSPEGRTQLTELYRRATFFILPTRAESAGIVFCEASAFGVPSLTLRTGGVEDYVRDGINGCCLPYDSKPESFARTIIEIIRDKDRYSALCFGAFNEYKARLNWDCTASALVNLCREAVQDQESRSSR